MRSLFVVLLLVVCAAGQDSRNNLPIRRVSSALPIFDALPRPVLPTRLPIEHRPVPLPVPITMRQIVRGSALIFSGTVMRVEQKPATAANPLATTEITFHVQQAMHGVRAGEAIRIREWAALWNSGERYRTGDTLVLFLYPPSKLGLTSPVGGGAGRFVVRGGQVLIGAQHVPLLPTNARDFSMSLKDFAIVVRKAEE